MTGLERIDELCRLAEEHEMTVDAESVAAAREYFSVYVTAILTVLVDMTTAGKILVRWPEIGMSREF